MKKLFCMMMVATMAGTSMAQNSAINKARAIFDESAVQEEYKDANGEKKQRTVIDWDKVKQAQEILTPAFTNPKTKDLASAWMLQADIHQRYVVTEINKAAEETPLDTLLLFSKLTEMLDAYYECSKADVKGVMKLSANDQISKFRVYYLFCGQFFSNNSDQIHSYEAFEAWLNFPTRYEQIGENLIARSQGDRNPNMIAYYAALTAYQSKQYDKMDGLRQMAMEYTEESENVHQLYLAATLERGDTAAWEQMGESFALEGSAGPGIVQNLLAHYFEKGQNDKVIAFADKIIAQRPQDKLGPYARGLVAMNAENYEEAIKWFDKSLEIDPDYFEGLFQCGACYLNIAFNLNDALANKQMTKAENEKALEPIRENCRKAEPYFVHIREIRPDDTMRWAPRLRQIYYIIDDKEKLEEVSPYCNFDE